MEHFLSNSILWESLQIIYFGCNLLFLMTEYILCSQYAIISIYADRILYS